MLTLLTNLLAEFALTALLLKANSAGPVNALAEAHFRSLSRLSLELGCEAFTLHPSISSDIGRSLSAMLTELEFVLRLSDDWPLPKLQNELDRAGARIAYQSLWNLPLLIKLRMVLYGTVPSVHAPLLQTLDFSVSLCDDYQTTQQASQPEVQLYR